MPAGPGKPPTPEQDQLLNNFLAAEADFFGQLMECVEKINEVLKSIAGDKASNTKTYVSREDYKKFFRLDDATIDSFVDYVTNIKGRAELVRDMPKDSVLSQRKSAMKTIRK